MAATLKQHPLIPRPSLQVVDIFADYIKTQKRTSKSAHPGFVSPRPYIDETNQPIQNWLCSGDENSYHLKAATDFIVASQNSPIRMIKKLRGKKQKSDPMSKLIQQSLGSVSTTESCSLYEISPDQKLNQPFMGESKLNSQFDPNQSSVKKPITRRSFLLQNGRMNWKVFKRAPRYGVQSKAQKKKAAHTSYSIDITNPKMLRKFNNFVQSSDKAIERKSIMMTGLSRRDFEKQKKVQGQLHTSLENRILEKINYISGKPKQVRDHSPQGVLNRVRSQRLEQEALNRKLLRLFSDSNL